MISVRPALQVIQELARPFASPGVAMFAAAATIGTTVIAAGGTLAGFQADTTNPSNTFNSGVLRITNVAGTGGTGTDCTTENGTVGVLTGTCKQLVNATLRVPGDQTSNSVVIKNVGTIDGLLSLSMGTQSSGNAQTPNSSSGIPACVATDYPSKISITILEGSTTVLTTRALSTVSGSIPLSSNTFIPAAEKTYTVNLSFDATVGNDYQNCAASFPLQWTMVQRAANSSSLPNASGSSQ